MPTNIADMNILGCKDFVKRNFRTLKERYRDRTASILYAYMYL